MDIYIYISSIHGLKYHFGLNGKQANSTVPINPQTLLHITLWPDGDFEHFNRIRLENFTATLHCKYIYVNTFVFMHAKFVPKIQSLLSLHLL